MLLARIVVVSDTPITEPILRIRLDRPAPSVRSCGESVAKATMFIGTNTRPIPAPWKKVTQDRVATLTAGRPAGHVPTATRPSALRPTVMIRRGSSFIGQPPGEDHRHHHAQAARHHQEPGLGHAVRPPRFCR